MGQIVTPEGLIPGEGDKPARPPTMEERINGALQLWKFKRKDEAFAAVLNCVAFLSHGLAGMSKITEVMRAENKNLHERLKTLEGKANATDT